MYFEGDSKNINLFNDIREIYLFFKIEISQPYSNVPGATLMCATASKRVLIGKNGRRGRKSGLGVEWIVRPFYQRYHKSHVDRVTRSIFTRAIGPSQKIQFKYEKVKFYDLLNGSIELVFRKI